MILYNVTVKTDHAIAEEWLQWLQQEHIPDMISTGCFTHAKVLHLMEQDESDGITYAVQYFAENKSQYDKYIENFANSMRKKGMDKWGNKFISFRSVMEFVN
jgi:Domain of unknown function (DUF4286)